MTNPGIGRQTQLPNAGWGAERKGTMNRLEVRDSKRGLSTFVVLVCSDSVINNINLTQLQFPK